MNINLRAASYVLVCAIALLYLAVANAEGYVPFATPTSRSSEHTVNHFHK